MNNIQAIYFNILWYSQSNLFGIGSIVNMTINDMDPDIALKLSDICWDTGHNYMVDAVNYSAHIPVEDEPYYSIDKIMSSNSLNTKPNYIIQFTSRDDYIASNKKYNLFGLLPWDAEVLPTDDNQYVCKVLDGTDNRALFNPFRKEVLIMKTTSVMIIGLSLFVTYKITKYGLGKLKNLV